MINKFSNALVAAIIFIQALSAFECNPPEPKPCPSEPKCFQQGTALKGQNSCEGKYPAAYNAPAAIAVNRSWNINFNASFIFWYYGQDEMDIASIRPTLDPDTDGQIFTQPFSYQPGFKVGGGCNPKFDDWTLDGEYTWFHNSKGVSYSSEGKNLFTSNMMAALPLHEYEFGHVHSEWTMHLDMVDVVAGRPFYQGKNLTVAPSGGLRGLWIRQKVNSTFTNPAGANDPSTPAKGEASSHCWSIGPKGSVKSNWMVWKYIRFEGEFGGSLLYTRYTKIENEVSFPLEGFSSSSEISNVSTLRPTMEAGLGMGCGGYFLRDRFHLDLAVRYDFLQFWSQNMMRNFASQLQSYDDGIGDLFMHGLTATLRFDF